MKISRLWVLILTARCLYAISFSRKNRKKTNQTDVVGGDLDVFFTIIKLVP